MQIFGNLVILSANECGQTHLNFVTVLLMALCCRRGYAGTIFLHCLCIPKFMNCVVEIRLIGQEHAVVFNVELLYSS